MKTKLIITALVAFGLSSAVARDCGNKLSWRTWESKFHQLLKAKHISEPRHETTSLRAAYCNGASPEDACEEIGCDAVEFAEVYMPKVRRLAKTLGATITEGDEAMEECIWFSFFLEHKSPYKAAKWAFENIE